ncbi:MULTISPECIES: hypothetical protein [Peribacillus]
MLRSWVVLLIPIVYTIAKRTGSFLVKIGIPLLVVRLLVPAYLKE